MRPPRSLQLLAIAALLSAALALLVTGGPAEAAIDFEEQPTQIPSETSGVQMAVAMATGPEDMLYAVWEDDRFTSLQQGRALLLAWSEPDDRGRAWSDEVRIPSGDSRNDATSPAIAVGPDGVVHVVWQELQVVDSADGGPYWEVRYASSTDNGLTWQGLRVSMPNNRNNTRPHVVGVSGASAYVAWELEDHPGSSIALAFIDTGSRAWIRDDFAEASSDWEVNSHVRLGVGTDGRLHAAWQAEDMDGMWEVLTSQVLYRVVEMSGRDTIFPEPVPLADKSTNVTNTGPTLAVTKRQGAWVAWAQEDSSATVEGGVTILADRVVDGSPGMDIVVARPTTVPDSRPSVAAARGPDDGLVLVISWVGTPTSPPLFTSTCSELGCFSVPVPVLPSGTPASVRAAVAVDGLENVYVGWDDGRDVVCTQRGNNPPGPPELLRPDRASTESKVEFVWSFNDVDAGASQSGFEIAYSMDQAFPVDETMGGVVLGGQGRTSRYVAPESIDEGRWYWRVRTRDQLGLWSAWSPISDFLADRTPPVGRVVINDGDEYTSERVVVLTLNATDNLEGLGGDMWFSISTDPDFPDAAQHEWPPINQRANQELPEGEGIKVVFFRIFDAAGLAHTSMDTIIYNATPIRIFHSPITSAPLGKPLNVSCEIMGPSEVATTLYYRRTYDEEFFELEMEANGTRFWAEIPKDHMSVKGVLYYVEARASGVIASAPEENPAEQPYEIEVYETTDVYQPPIYSPIVTFTGALVVLIALVLIWWYRLRD